jgi:K+-transporting ATPase KdpF subunit
VILASLGDNLVALVLSVALIAYLVVVLIAPERF